MILKFLIVAFSESPFILCSDLVPEHARDIAANLVRLCIASFESIDHHLIPIESSRVRVYAQLGPRRV